MKYKEQKKIQNVTLINKLDMKFKLAIQGFIIAEQLINNLNL